MKYEASTIGQAVEIMRLIVYEQTPVGLRSIAGRLCLDETGALAIVKALERQGYVVRDASTGKYAAGRKLHAFADTVAEQAGVGATARPYIEELAAILNKTVFLGVRKGDGIVIANLAGGKNKAATHALQGALLPITAGAVGNVFLSFLPEEDVLRRVRSLAPNTITDTALILGEIERTRSLGYSVSLEGRAPGGRAVAAAVRSGTEPLGVLWVAGLTDSVTYGRLLRTIRYICVTADLIGHAVSSRMPYDRVPETGRRLRAIPFSDNRGAM